MSTSAPLAIKSHQGIYHVHYLDSLSQLSGRFRTVSAPMVVCDEKIYGLYREILAPLLAATPHLLITATEEEKTWRGIERVCTWLQEKKASKASQLVAIGGGITQDIAAFSAHIFFRGIPWYFVPTTLLAQADSCIGSKCGINFNGYKNQLGSFQPPQEVWLCTDFVDSLSDREVASGYGEILRLALTGSREFFYDLQTEVSAKGLRKALTRDLIARCLTVKKTVIEEDEYERNYRRILNYGHTFGHALESITDYEIPHGLAVAWGMDLINYLSWKRNLLSEKTFLEVHGFIKAHLPFQVTAPISVEALVEKTKKDKKASASDITLALFEGMGKLRLEKTRWDETLIGQVREYLERYHVYR